MEVFAGEKAFTKYNDWLPQETVDAMQEFRVSIKGPLTTPVGGGIRSLNVTLRQVLDLYACIRPVRYFEGVGSPMKEPGEAQHRRLPREHRGRLRRHRVEGRLARGGEAARVHRDGVRQEDPRALGHRHQADVGVRLQALIEMAIRYALKHCLPSVTLMHKGNIMKFTEGAFRDWGYELAREKFADEHRVRERIWRRAGRRRAPTP